MKQITIGDQNGKAIGIDLLKLIDTRLLVQANSGGGKSWVLRLLAERAGDKLQTIILDNEGEFATLREQLDMVLVSGSDGEVMANPRSAGLLARRLIETQVSAVIDLYDLKLPMRREFVKLFLESLIHLPRELWRPTLVIIDEAHLYCPERGSGEAESTDAVIALMSQGRKRGYCGVLATQRLSKLHKDAAAECNNVLIGRTSLDNDQVRAGDILGMGKTDRLELRNLGEGEWYGFGPAFSDRGVFRFHAGEVQTTHPKPGQRHALTAPAPSAKVRAMLAKLADIPQAAEAEIRDLAGAKRRIVELERKVRARPQAAPSSETTGRAVSAAVRDVEQRYRIAFRDADKKHNDAYRALKTHVDRIGKLFAGAFKVHEQIAGELLKFDAVPIPAGEPVQTSAHVVEAPARQPPPVLRTPAARAAAPSGDLSGPEQRILDAIAWMESIGVAEPELTAVAFLAGYTIGGGAFNNPRGALRTKGLIDYRGDRLALTNVGRGKANFPDATLTPEELQRRVLERLPGPEQKILRVLIEDYPNSVDNDDLARRSGYEPGGGAFNNPKGRLRSLGLADYPERGKVVARSVLFMEGR